MEARVSDSSILTVCRRATENPLGVKRRTLQAMVERCQRGLELLDDDDDDDNDGDKYLAPSGECSSAMLGDREADELCDLVKSKFECPDFLEKMGSLQPMIPQYMSEESSTWDMVSVNDLWEGVNIDRDPEEYVLVSQEDIVGGIAYFITAYLLSLKETKELTPNQLQKVLCKTFSAEKKKGKLRKTWDGSKLIYNVASWGATAIGIYQNPALIHAASEAFWASCHVLSKLI